MGPARLGLRQMLERLIPADVRVLITVEDCLARVDQVNISRVEVARVTATKRRRGVGWRVKEAADVAREGPAACKAR